MHSQGSPDILADKLRWYSGFNRPLHVFAGGIFVMVVKGQNVMKTNSNMRKKAWILLILVMVAMLIPVKYDSNNGRKEYRAIAYQIVKYHDNNACDIFQGSHWFGKKIGTEIKIFGFLKSYDSVKFVPNHADVVLSPAE